MIGAIRRAIFSLPYREISWAHRGFPPCAPEVQVRIEDYFTKFLDGYHLAIDAASLEELGAQIDATVGSELIGFAYEGAGMYLALCDFLFPGRRDRVRRFTAGPAKRHDFITQIGIGLIFSRLPWVKRDVAGALKRLDPGVGWFAVDGYGFHEGFFDHRRFIERCESPKHVEAYAARCFDHGLGRSLWFVSGASPERIAAAIAQFPAARHADLWAGIGLACAFAGGVHASLADYQAVLEAIVRDAGQFRPELGLGVVFAADTRVKAGTASPWTSRAAELVLGMSAEEAGALSLSTLEQVKQSLLGASDEEVRRTGYEEARLRIMSQLRTRWAASGVARGRG